MSWRLKCAVLIDFVVYFLPFSHPIIFAQGDIYVISVTSVISVAIVITVIVVFKILYFMYIDYKKLSHANYLSSSFASFK